MRPLGPYSRYLTQLICFFVEFYDFLGFSGRKQRLLKLFEGWCEDVIDLLQATEEDAILRRDIYDHNPIFTWGKGRVTLLGDSVHAMQPNLGQGGCMAIEVQCTFNPLPNFMTL